MNCPRCQKDFPRQASSCPSCGFSFDDATQRLGSQPAPPSKPTDKRSSTSFDSLDDGRFVPGTILAERYRIVGLLGRGGMGEVYRADDLKLGQPVALKFLPEDLLSDGAALARFHREVRVARQVSHKNVCRVYDIGEIEGRHFLSMELIKGEELSSLLRRIGRLPQDKAVQIARQICAGLAAAHESGVLHRDLKPSNVMIDEHGDARITDFGLAGLEEELRDEGIVAGTPAYMAPEQLEGKTFTVRSDIYSLGLLLYELFTGKKAFDAATLGDVLKLRKSDPTPTTPTSIVKGLDPLIEKVIDRCIQKDPAERPSSALQVAAALPGGDPIAAALAAGETPSPEMVAAAPKKGTLRPAVAGGLLAAVIIFLGLTMLLARRVGLQNIIPLEKSPELLKADASQIAKTFGYANATDTVTGFEPDFQLYVYLYEHQTSLDAWKVLRHSQPPVIRFWYRQGKRLLLPLSEQWVTREDPPNNIPGMVRIDLDTDGKLFYFEAVPERVSSSEQSPVSSSEFRVPSSQQNTPSPETRTPGSSPTVREGLEPETRNSKLETDIWPAMFRAAGLDLSKFQSTETQWTPPQAFDAHQAWTGVYPNLPQVPIRIEAAAYHGKLVYFEIISPWSKPSWQLADERGIAQKIGTWVLLGMFFGTLLMGALLAWRNLRLGRGDRRGAFRLALFFFLIRMAFWVFATHHVADTRELLLLVTGIQSALFWSCFVGVMYLALEPYLRRRWPDLIISWNRLLAGDFRDPLIGRDILIGLALGFFCVMLMHLRVALSLWVAGQGTPDVLDGWEFGVAGTSAFGVMFISQVSAGMAQAFMVVFLLLFLSLLLRKDWAGTLLGTLILAAIFVVPAIGHERWVGLLAIAIAIVLFVFCAERFGPLALMATLVVFHIWVFYPITTHLTTWYASSFVLVSIILLALAIYCFFVSLGGQKILSGKLLQE